MSSRPLARSDRRPGRARETWPTPGSTFVNGDAIRLALKSLASATHRVVSRDSRLASCYLGLFRSLKLLPDGRWKQFVLNSLQSIQWPDLALPPSKVDLTPEVKAAITPHLGEFDFAAHLCRRLDYERETASWLVERRYDTIVEIGANVGYYTLLFSKLLPDAKVYSFEPSRTAYRRLLENLALNDCRNVLPFNCAVASRPGFVTFYEPQGHLTNGSLDASFARIFAEVVQATKVASMSGRQIQELCQDSERLLLKIDVEGAEPAVVRTLESVIVSKVPEMLIEVLPHVVDDLNQIDCLRSYRLFHLTTQGPVERETFVSKIDCGRDYALVPR
jgi:FkbM family methyltransferase